MTMKLEYFSLSLGPEPVRGKGFNFPDISSATSTR